MGSPKRPGRRHARRKWIGSGVAIVAALAIAFVTFQVNTRHASAAGSLISQGKTAVASSVEGNNWPASAAVDGDTNTRWSSAFSDPQWIQIDLGATAKVDQVVLRWENAYGTAFRIETSPDAKTWTSVYSTTTGTGGNQTLNVTGSGRYVRMYGTARHNQYGFSLYEFQVYGTFADDNTTTASPTPVIGDATSTAAAPATGDATLISQGRPTVASSVESGATPPLAATDGDDTTRWSSQFKDPQWLQVDLGGTASISKVVLQWQDSYATAYQIQTSPDALTWTTIYSTTTGKGGTQTLDVTGTGHFVRVYATARNGGYGDSLYEFKVYGSVAGAVAPGGPGWVKADPQVTGVTPSTNVPKTTLFHEFQANCAATHDLPDDPIVHFGKPGASHMHTFMGSPLTNASSTPEQLLAGGTACKTPGDKSGYWMPAMYNGTKVVDPIGVQTIYYKSGVKDYKSVRPFPKGLRFVVGDPMATAADFHGDPGFQEGWECGDDVNNIDFPANCPAGSQLNIRYQAPSCWDGRYLDSPDHKSHMAYPVLGVCPKSHPVAVPMIEFKMAFPVSGDMSQVHLSSGRGFSFHYDFMNAWDQPTLQALVTQCINGGLQCDPRGFDETQPGRGAALNEQYMLP